MARGNTIRLLVLADTHVPDHARQIPDAILREARTVDLIVHAGDVTSAPVLDELARCAPVLAVAGNNDGPDVRGG